MVFVPCPPPRLPGLGRWPLASGRLYRARWPLRLPAPQGPPPLDRAPGGAVESAHARQDPATASQLRRPARSRRARKDPLPPWAAVPGFAYVRGAFGVVRVRGLLLHDLYRAKRAANPCAGGQGLARKSPGPGVSPVRKHGLRARWARRRARLLAAHAIAEAVSLRVLAEACDCARPACVSTWARGRIARLTGRPQGVKLPVRAAANRRVIPVAQRVANGPRPELG